jgi:transcription initiation factor TFIIIB Brf1 subunit/transcription initiation factor TFIIB
MAADGVKCPTCGPENIEENDPRPGEHTCRDCGEWIDDA